MVSPQYFKYKWQNRIIERTDAMELGSFVHALLTQPEKAKTYHRLPEGFTLQSNANKDRFAKLQVDGYTPLKWDYYNNGNGMAEAIKSNPVARDVIRFEYEGEDEMLIEWTDKRTGIKMKGFIDRWVKQKFLLNDFKTAADASPKSFMKTIFQMDYDAQGAIYFDGMRTLGYEPKYFTNIAVESKPPYGVGVYNYPAEVLLCGRRKYEKWLDFYQFCLDRNIWDASYEAFSESGIHEVQIPKWLQFENRNNERNS